MASSRWGAIQGLVARLQAITIAGGYQHNLNGLEQVTSGVLSRSMRMENPHDLQLQVQEGQEEHGPLIVSPHNPRKATLELMVDCMLRGGRDEAPRSRLNKLLEDINLAVGTDPTLGGAVQHARVARVDRPQYDPAGRISWVIVRLVVDYDYTAGTTT